MRLCRRYGSARCVGFLYLTKKAPRKLATVFAGVDREATDAARSHMLPVSAFCPPSIAIFQKRRVGGTSWSRYMIEGRSAEMIAEHLKACYERVLRIRRRNTANPFRTPRKKYVSPCCSPPVVLFVAHLYVVLYILVGIGTQVYQYLDTQTGPVYLSGGHVALGCTRVGGAC